MVRAVRVIKNTFPGEGSEEHESDSSFGADGRQSRRKRRSQASMFHSSQTPMTFAFSQDGHRQRIDSSEQFFDTEEALADDHDDEIDIPLDRHQDLVPLSKTRTFASSATSRSAEANSRRQSGEHLWRHRRFWDEDETECLKEGVRKYGKGKWKAILSDPSFSFKDRSSVDLKDKWRNLEMFVPWSDHEVRRYILLDENHVPVRTNSDGYHVFQNRWPRDAALKVASRDEFYPRGPDDSTPFLIFLREIKMAYDHTDKHDAVESNSMQHRDSSETTHESLLNLIANASFQNGAGSSEDVVHVYRGTRERRVAADIEKFQNKRFMWVPSVVKLRTEKLSYGKNAIINPICGRFVNCANAVLQEGGIAPGWQHSSENVPVSNGVGSGCERWSLRRTLLHPSRTNQHPVPLNSQITKNKMRGSRFLDMSTRDQILPCLQRYPDEGPLVYCLFACPMHLEDRVKALGVQ
ncbi:unnamed protein product, partial [Sphagnum compactum]